MELWDAYDEKFNKIEGKTLVRGETVDFKWVSREELLCMDQHGGLVTKRMQQFIEDLRR